MSEQPLTARSATKDETQKIKEIFDGVRPIIRIEKTEPRIEWTTEPPTKAGWYWVITNDLDWGNSPECVYIGCPEYDDILHVYGINPMHQIEPVTDYHNDFLRHWYGPVEPPARPEKG